MEGRREGRHSRISSTLEDLLNLNNDRTGIGDPKKEFQIIVIILSPAVVGTFVVLGYYWNYDYPCTGLLRVWCLVEGCRLVASIFHSWLIQRDVDRTETLQRFFVQIGWVLSLFSYVWFIIGHIWLIQAIGSSCVLCPVFDLAMALIVLQYSLILLPIIVFILLLPFLCLCSPCIIHMYRNSDYKTEKNGASRKQINQIPKKTYRKYVQEVGAERVCDSCSICLSGFTLKDTIRILPCEHIYHKNCLDNWLTIQSTCPVCRHDINQNVERQTSGEATIDIEMPSLPTIDSERLRRPRRHSSLSRSVSELSVELAPRPHQHHVDDTLSNIETAVVVSRNVAAPRFLFSLRNIFVRNRPPHESDDLLQNSGTSLA